MVNFGQEAGDDAAIWQRDAVKHMKFPERKTPVEQFAVQLRAALVRLGQRHGVRAFFGRISAPDMEVNVHRWRVNPGRMSQIQRHQHQLAREHGCQVQPLANMLLHRLVKASLEPRRQLAQVERAHVHGHFRGFKVKKTRVQSGQGVHFSGLRAVTLTESGIFGTRVCRGGRAGRSIHGIAHRSVQINHETAPWRNICGRQQLSKMK